MLKHHHYGEELIYVPMLYALLFTLFVMLYILM